MLPQRSDLAAYRGATFDFTLSFQNEDGSPWDLSQYQSVKIRFFTLNNQDNPEAEVTPEVENNDVSGTLSSEQTKFFYNRVVYYEAIFTKNDSSYYKANGRLTVWNVGPRPELNSTATIQVNQPG